MRRNVILLTICTLCVVVCVWLIVSSKKQTKPQRPNFTVVLKDSIYIEYGVDLTDTKPMLNIIESNVIDELKSSIPSNAEYFFEIDNSVPSFDFYERARILKWDEEGKELFPGTISVGAILGFHHMVGNSTEGMRAITQQNIEAGLEEVKPYQGSFTLKIGDYSETFNFDYYVIEVFLN